MTRPSSNTDKKLIRAGVKLFRTKGISGLVLREVAEAAKVNLGMFHYHFKTKEQFAKAVLKEFYDDFFEKFEKSLIAQSSGSRDLSHFEEALFTIGTYVHENAQTLALVAKDILNGEKLVLEFVAAHGYRHIVLMENIIREGQKNGTIRKDVPSKQILIMVATTVGLSTALGFQLQTLFPNPVKKEIKAQFLDLKQIRLRLQVLIAGLRP